MKEVHRFDRKEFMVKPGKTVLLKDYKTKFKGAFKEKDDAKAALLDDVTALSQVQNMLYASHTYGVLIVLQAMDAAGKDGVIRHVMTGINPQGCQVHSFKAPTEEEKMHPFLWRPSLRFPAAGQIAIFNRSYYEEVLVVKVHPEFLEGQFLSEHDRENPEDIWKNRYQEINDMEERATRNGIVIIKFFLNVSQKEQKNRFLERIDNPEKNWKFFAGDIKERQFWKKYQKAYQEMLSATSTKEAPWYIIPADDKQYSRAIVADIIRHRIEDLKLSYPILSREAETAMLQFKEQLLDEG